MRILLLLVALASSVGSALAADKPEGGKAPAKKDSTEAPVVTHHQIHAAGKVLKYTVTTGKLPLKNETGETEAEIFFMAYTLDGVGNPASRPLMFSFNGGPGSASVWLHLGALGPKRVKMRADGAMPS
ncbi:MAG: peptidase S10, partial [Candidatus Eisenbacteria bacterium]